LFVFFDLSDDFVVSIVSTAIVRLLYYFACVSGHAIIAADNDDSDDDSGDDYAVMMRITVEVTGM
jgi:hypothetical protein